MDISASAKMKMPPLQIPSAKLRRRCGANAESVGGCDRLWHTATSSQEADRVPTCATASKPCADYNTVLVRKEPLRQSVIYDIIPNKFTVDHSFWLDSHPTHPLGEFYEFLDTRQIRSSKNVPVGGVEGALAPGRVLQDRYEVLGILGLGGMSAVYQARDRRFPNVVKLCAVKEMKSHSLDPQMRQVAVQNFEREANILATLSHPAIPKVYDYFSEEARSYLVMEFIEGRDLEAVLGEMTSFLPQEQVLEWAIQLCDVLQFLHDHTPAIIFRDMKPSNIMLDKHGRLRLIDFGIAKNFQPGQKGTMIGTEGYSPPEQYRGIADQRTDIYALGATLHHILSRQDPRVEPPFSFPRAADSDGESGGHARFCAGYHARVGI